LDGFAREGWREAFEHLSDGTAAVVTQLPGTVHASFVSKPREHPCLPFAFALTPGKCSRGDCTLPGILLRVIQCYLCRAQSFESESADVDLCNRRGFTPLNFFDDLLATL